MLKKCLDKRNCMTGSGAAAVNPPKCQYFHQMAFLHEKSVNKVTETNLSQPSTFYTEILTEENQGSALSSPSAAIAATLILQRKVQKKKKRRTDSMRPDALAQSLQD